MAELSGTEARLDLLRRGVTVVDGKCVRVLGAGQFNNAFLVEDRVVRVPKSQLALEGLRREAEFLANARARLVAEVPSFLEEKLGEAPNDAYVVHRLIPGQVVREPWLGEMPIDDLNRFASAVARFLKSLRALTSTRAADALERTDLDSWWTQLIADLEADVTPHLEPHVGTRIIAELRSDAPAAAGTPAVVCHGDLGGNLLWGPDGLGVIDLALARSLTQPSTWPACSFSGSDSSKRYSAPTRRWPSPSTSLGRSAAPSSLKTRCGL
jgi:hypothetical protein